MLRIQIQLKIYQKKTTRRDRQSVGVSKAMGCSYNYPGVSIGELEITLKFRI